MPLLMAVSALFMVRPVMLMKVLTALCFKDDTLDTGPSVVEVVIANGPGYTVHPERGRIEFTITDNDDCARPDDTPGGVVYKESGCRCATESLHPSVRRHGSQTTILNENQNNERTYTQPEEAYQQTLSNLANHFSDPSYLYCPESPWKGLP